MILDGSINEKSPWSRGVQEFREALGFGPQTEPDRSNLKFQVLDQSIVPIAVVGATNGNFLEAQPSIEGFCGLIGTGHLQGGPLGTSPLGQAKQPLHYSATQAKATVVRMHGHGGDVELIDHKPGTGQSHKRAVVAPPNHHPVGLSELHQPLLLCPQPTQALAIQADAIGPILLPQAKNRLGEQAWLNGFR